MVVVAEVVTMKMTKVCYIFTCSTKYFSSVHTTRSVSHYRCGMDLLKTLHDWLVCVAMCYPIQSSQQGIHCCLCPQVQGLTPSWISHTPPLTKVFSVHTVAWRYVGYMEIKLLALVLALYSGTVFIYSFMYELCCISVMTYIVWGYNTLLSNCNSHMHYYPHLSTGQSSNCSLKKCVFNVPAAVMIWSVYY